MKLQKISTQKTWDAFVSAQPYAQFLQSWAWGEFRRSQNSPIHRFALVDEAGTWQLALLIEYRPKRFGLGYWFSPRGPIFASTISPADKPQLMQQLTQALLKHPELKHGSLFWRMEPLSKLAEAVDLMPPAFHRTHAMNPATSAVLDLTPSEEELQKRMHEKTRYNIRLAAKHGVTVRLTTDETDLAIFLDLMQETAKRDGFMQHPRRYLEATYRFLAEQGIARLRIAEREGKILSANLEMHFGDTVTYLYGSSSSEQRQVMAPFALQWHAIRDAKAKGAYMYDFGGANPDSKSDFYYKSSWEGITRFKKSWGADCLTFIGTWDLPLNLFLYRLIFRH